MDKINVIILEKDSCHGESRANGFYFFVKKEIKITLLLKNFIY